MTVVRTVAMITGCEKLQGEVIRLSHKHRSNQSVAPFWLAVKSHWLLSPTKLSPYVCSRLSYVSHTEDFPVTSSQDKHLFSFQSILNKSCLQSKVRKLEFIPLNCEGGKSPALPCPSPPLWKNMSCSIHTPRPLSYPSPAFRPRQTIWAASRCGWRSNILLHFDRHSQALADFLQTEKPTSAAAQIW